MDTTIPSHLPAEDKETPTVKWNVSFRVKKNVKNNYKILKKEKVQYFRREASQITSLQVFVPNHPNMQTDFKGTFKSKQTFISFYIRSHTNVFVQVYKITALL